MALSPLVSMAMIAFRINANSIIAYATICNHHHRQFTKLRGKGVAKLSNRGKGGGAAAKRAPSAWPAFLTAHDALVVQIEERLRDAGLPDLNWYVVLWVLERAPDRRLRMHELADTAVIARSNLTRLVDRMEKANLVARERVSGDRRGAYARLTPAGREMRARMWVVYGPAIQELFTRHLSADENATLRGLMMRLLSRARDEKPAS